MILSCFTFSLEEHRGSLLCSFNYCLFIVLCIDKILCVIFISLLSIWTFQVISCTNIMHLSTERLSVVDPGGPSYVYIPVSTYKWTKETLFADLLLESLPFIIGISMDMLETNVGGHVSHLHCMDHQRHHCIVLATWLEAAMTKTVSGAIAITLSCVVCWTFAPEMEYKCSQSNLHFATTRTNNLRTWWLV
jgi:hypothetical protein